MDCCILKVELIKTMLSFLCVTLVLSVFKNCLGDEDSSSLFTGFTSNTGVQGIEFDIKAKKDVVITSMDFNFNGCDDDYISGSFALYSKAGSHVGFEELSSTWTYVCGGKVYCDVYGNPSSNTGDAGNCDVAIKAGNTQAFYIQGVSRGLLSLRYDTDEIGDLLASDENINAYIGTGMLGQWQSYQFAFRETVRIYYSLSTYTNSANSANSAITDGFYCDDLCKINVEYYNDEYCDCSNCEDEDFFTCKNCVETIGNCDYVAELCGNYIQCTTHWYSKNSDNNDDNDDNSDDTKAYGHGDHNGNNNNNNNNNNTSSAHNTGLIIGLICGAIGLLIIITIGIYFSNKNKKIRNQVRIVEGDHDYTPPNVNVLTTQQE